MAQPLIGLGKGDPNLWWRKYIFKPIHGTFGIFFVTVWGSECTAAPRARQTCSSTEDVTIVHTLPNACHGVMHMQYAVLQCNLV